MIQVTIVPKHYGKRYRFYGVMFEGEEIVRAHRDPEYTAARVLVDRGYSGPFETLGLDGRVRMNFPDLHGAARLRTVEGEKALLCVAKWEPFNFSPAEPEDGETAGPGSEGARDGERPF